MIYMIKPFIFTAVSVTSFQRGKASTLSQHLYLILTLKV